MTSDAETLATDSESTSSILDSEAYLDRLLLVSASPTDDVQPDKV